MTGPSLRKDSSSLCGPNDAKPRILIVDDEPYVCELLHRWLQAEGYDCTEAYDGESAWKQLEWKSFSLLISDIMMPGMSGIRLLTMVKERYPDVAVIMVTALGDRNTAVGALHLGAYGYVIKPFDSNEMLISIANALERRRLVLESRAYEHRLEETVRQRTATLRRREEEVALRLVMATGYRDVETGAHIRRIGLYAAALTKQLGWDNDLIDQIRLSGPMHDVGKIGVPDHILRKPARLTRQEFEAVKAHTKIGASILGGSDIPLLQTARDIASGHHERWDGTGYPKGLAGEAVPECARVVAIADVYDALVNERVYKPPLPEEEAIALMLKGKGKHFDPRIFECFLDIASEFRRIREEIPDSGPVKEVSETD